MGKKAIITLVVIVVVLAGGGALLAANHNSNNSKNTSSTTSANNSMKNMGTSSQQSSNSTPSATNSVTIQSFAFSPASITVTKGTTVTWTNKDSTTHTVTSTSGPKSFDSGDLANGKNYSFTFDTAGTYQYHCSIHPEMLGTVIVTE